MRLMDTVTRRYTTHPIAGRPNDGPLAKLERTTGEGRALLQFHHKDAHLALTLTRAAVEDIANMLNEVLEDW